MSVESQEFWLSASNLCYLKPLGLIVPSSFSLRHFTAVPVTIKRSGDTPWSVRSRQTLRCQRSMKLNAAYIRYTETLPHSLAIATEWQATRWRGHRNVTESLSIKFGHRFPPIPTVLASQFVRIIDRGRQSRASDMIPVLV